MRQIFGAFSAFWGLWISLVFALELSNRTPLTEAAAVFKWLGVLILIVGAAISLIVGLSFAESKPTDARSVRLEEK